MTTTPRTTTTKTTTDPHLAAQLKHARAWLKDSKANDAPDVHQAQQRVDELVAQIKAEGTVTTDQQDTDQ